jgi:glutamyl-tRNA synthetase
VAPNDGRFAPSPTGELHLGNLRTALLAWLFARASDARFVVRMEDLDRHNSSRQHAAGQLADLAALGLDWDGPVLFQSERFELYHEAIAELAAKGLVYECWCTRREIRDATAAPNGPQSDAYPRTCRECSTAETTRLRRQGRRPALRLRAAEPSFSVVDALHGMCDGAVDDIVLRRNDEVPAYNLAVVVDDAAQGIGQVVRGDDLLSCAPSQAYLQHELGLATTTLALAPEGTRLAKRHGSVTMAELAAKGIDASRVRSLIAASAGLWARDEPVSMHELVASFDVERIVRTPWIVRTEDLA